MFKETASGQCNIIKISVKEKPKSAEINNKNSMTVQ
jgi:hypothetical protein